MEPKGDGREPRYPQRTPASRRRGVLGEEVVDYVRELILTGTIRSGEKIDQQAISEALGVSRSPIREALVVLGREGLVELTPRRGAAVAELSPEDIIDHYALFGVVSGRAAALAAETIDAEGLSELRKVHLRFLAAGSDGTELGPDELQQLNHDFHRIINLTAPGRTRWLLRHLEHSVPSSYYEFADGWNHTAVEHHAAILEAIASGDADGARRAMESHLQASGEAAAAQLAARGFFGDDIKAMMP
jgi:DNA-binding GntR family transcriptional regulator